MDDNEDLHMAEGSLSDDVGESLPEKVSIDNDNLSW
jgi:hypothetical protein